MSNLTFSISVDSGMLDDSEPIPVTLQNRIFYQRRGPDLDLSLCSIAKVPLEAIRDLYGREVTALNLAYNRIRYLPSNFVHEMRNTLVSLDLSRNQLKKLPDNFGELDQLVILDIHQNKLQSLPMSMGKMKRLTYLNLADNPFGPPLYDFLEFEKRGSNGNQGAIETAHSVINFLSTVSQQSSSARDSSRNLPSPTPVVERQRTVKFVEESSAKEKSKSTLTHPSKSNIKASVTTITETTGNSDDEEIKEDEFIPKKFAVQYSDSELGPYLKKKVTETDKKDPSWLYRGQVHRGRGQTLAGPAPKPVVILPKADDARKIYKLYGVFMFVVWLLMFPVIMAMFYETSALDHFVKGGEILEPLWKNYRPYHESIEIGMDFVGWNRGFVVRAPSPKKSKYYDVNQFTAMFYALREGIASIFQGIADFIQP